ncbi:MAG: hypothetical protein AB7M05_15990 [Alphaproteobacteria bacterium]
MLQPLLRPASVAANDRLRGASPLALPAPPVLDLDFVGRPSLHYPGLPPISFARASTAARVNASGLIETVAADAPRFDHHPLTGARRGLLVEGERTNICLESETLATSPWTPEHVTVNVNQAVAPDGAATADKLEETVDNSFHRIAAGFSMTVTNVAHTVSFWTKADERSSGFVDIYHGDGSGFAGSFVFDLATGTVGSLTGIVASAEIEAWPNGWYRVWCVFTPNAGSDGRFDLGICNPADNTRGTYVGTVGSGLFYWGAQLEAGAFPTSYIKTMSAPTTRVAESANVATSGYAFNSNAGTLLWCGRLIGFAGGITFSDGTTNNQINLRLRSGRTLGQVVTTSGETVVNSTSSNTATANEQFRSAMAWALNDYAASLSAGEMITDSLGAVPIGLTNLKLTGDDSTLPHNGWLERVTYWPSRLSDEIVLTLTAP